MGRAAMGLFASAFTLACGPAASGDGSATGTAGASSSGDSESTAVASVDSTSAADSTSWSEAGSTSSPWGPAVVEGDCESVIVDPALALLVWATLGLAPGSVIPAEQLAALENLWAEGLGITSLEGLQCAVGLRALSIWRSEDGQTNAVSDLGPVQELSQLERLYAGYNPIGEIEPIAGLTQLRVLDVRSTQVADLGPLGACPALESLYASETPITDVGPLLECDAIQNIELDASGVEDVTLLASLPELRRLEISGTAASNIQAFDQSQLGILFANEIDVAVIPTDMPTYAVRLAGNGITDLSPLLTWAGPSTVDLSNNAIEDPTPLLAMPWELGPGSGNCLELDLQGNPLSHPDSATVLQQVCAQYFVRLQADQGLGCSHEECDMGPPP